MNYSTCEAAIALGVSSKQLDNLIVRSARELSAIGRQGISRALSEATIERIAIALLLRRDLSIPLGTGMDLAVRLSRAEDGVTPVGTLGTLTFDLRRLRVVLRQALAETVQDRIPIRRGRPNRALKEKRGASL